MQSFLENVLFQLNKNGDRLEELTYIVPSKRAVIFLNKHLSSYLNTPVFAPKIYSIEEFIAEIAGLEYATNTELLFELYSSYSKVALEEKDDFSSFLKWGQTLLQDFNEINRYLVDHNSLFQYLTSIQKLNNWGLSAKKSELISNYLDFWNSLPAIYTEFTQHLLQNKKGYQGLVYQQASAAIESYLKLSPNKTFAFIGFNALNNAESRIIQKFLVDGSAKIYFDLDAYFLKDPIHSSSHFIRYYKNTWPYFKSNDLLGITTNYASKKSIQIIGVPKSVPQAKYAGNLISKIYSTNRNDLKNAALILADESLLEPVLNSIPNTLKKVNITMGLSLQNTALASFFEALFELHINKSKNGFFYQDFLKFLSNPYTATLFTEGVIDYSKKLQEKIHNNNWVFLSLNQILAALPTHQKLISKIFLDCVNGRDLLKTHQYTIELLKEKISERNSFYDLEQLYHFYRITNQIEAHLDAFKFGMDLKALKNLFFELLSKETLDFRGDAMEGLQIMGMLESRVLDFETVIITSVNEGILPSGKSNNSFIPYDVKQEFGLPTYKEKDAIYTYHFYRILQRAKNVYLIYNTEPDVLEGGEKSRFINQLLTDENINKFIIHSIASSKVKSNIPREVVINKSPMLLEELQILAAKGFSPTSLTNYIRNPIEFYRNNILKIDTLNEVEESIALNTFGTIIHDALEDLYSNFVTQRLTQDMLLDAKQKVPSVVQRHFNKSHSEADLTKGKNLIIYNVIIKYVADFIAYEIEQLKKHQIRLLGVELNLRLELNIPELAFPVVLKGKIDRIDEIDGQLRILDYKTGTVNPSEVELMEWDSIVTDKKFSKAFQLLCYSLMYRRKEKKASFEAGIISIKKISAGVFRFATKSSTRGPKEHTIDSDVLSVFESRLKQLILEIFNPEVPFTDKEY